jgi:hypothetical protein
MLPPPEQATARHHRRTRTDGGVAVRLGQRQRDQPATVAAPAPRLPGSRVGSTGECRLLLCAAVEAGCARSGRPRGHRRSAPSRRTDLDLRSEIPEAWGYARTRHTGYLSDDEKGRRAAADAEAAARRAALATAGQVRQEFLRARYGTARGARKVYVEALRDTVTDPDTIAFTGSYGELADAVAGIPLVSAAETAGIDRLARMLVGRWLAAAEQNVAGMTTGWIGQVDAEAGLRHLDLLVADG